MMTRERRVRWAAVVGVMLGLGACDDSPSPSASSCAPACRSGYTCVNSACVSACNPGCSASEQCVTDASGARCVAITPGTDTGVPGDDATTQTDAPSIDGTVIPADVPPGTDVQTPPSDTPVVTTDAGDAAVRAPCGMAGQPCCGVMGGTPQSCAAGSVCNPTTRTCMAFTPDPDECTTTATCPAGQVCTYGAGACSAGTRGCLRCVVPPDGGTAMGTTCGGGAPVNCATGICANNRCTRTCVPGATGDAACRAIDPNTICAELAQRAMAGGPITTYGACIRSCRRDADCTGTQRCLLSSNVLGDTLVQTCREPFGSLAAGAACPLSPVLDGGVDDPGMYCQSEQCFSAAAGSSTGFCSTACITDADCPGASYACMEIPFFRPSRLGTTVPIRMCVRR